MLLDAVREIPEFRPVRLEIDLRISPSGLNRRDLTFRKKLEKLPAIPGHLDVQAPQQVHALHDAKIIDRVEQRDPRSLGKVRLHFLPGLSVRHVQKRTTPVRHVGIRQDLEAVNRRLVNRFQTELARQSPVVGIGGLDLLLGPGRRAGIVGIGSVLLPEHLLGELVQNHLLLHRGVGRDRAVSLERLHLLHLGRVHVLRRVHKTHVPRDLQRQLVRLLLLDVAREKPLYHVVADGAPPGSVHLQIVDLALQSPLTFHHDLGNHGVVESAKVVLRVELVRVHVVLQLEVVRHRCAESAVRQEFRRPIENLLQRRVKVRLRPLPILPLIPLSKTPILLPRPHVVRIHQR